MWIRTKDDAIVNLDLVNTISCNVNPYNGEFEVQVYVCGLPCTILQAYKVKDQAVDYIDGIYDQLKLERARSHANVHG